MNECVEKLSVCRHCLYYNKMLLFDNKNNNNNNYVAGK